mmetsp:Transcript_26768/g.55903  ORF Transcript_26768/g.55903 Transcript_26768/m.55903 type:complete len:224 (+) Transcript_26768:423-1094(+)
MIFILARNLSLPLFQSSRPSTTSPSIGSRSSLDMLATATRTKPTADFITSLAFSRNSTHTTPRTSPTMDLVTSQSLLSNTTLDRAMTAADLMCGVLAATAPRTMWMKSRGSPRASKAAARHPYASSRTLPFESLRQSSTSPTEPGMTSGCLLLSRVSRTCRRDLSLSSLEPTSQDISVSVMTLTTSSGPASRTVDGCEPRREARTRNAFLPHLPVPIMALVVR